MPLPAELASNLRSLATRYLHNSVAPYSRGRTAAVALLSTGEFVPGVRIETASFPLAIPALINLVTTTVAVDRRDVLAVVQSHAISGPEQSYIARSPIGPFALIEDDIAVRVGAPSFPDPTRELQPFVIDRGQSVDELLSDAMAMAARAITSESHFPVGAVVKCGDHLVPGVNVEHEFWPFSLCAERNALGTAVSYGLDSISEVYLSCLRDDSASPCGACRQVLSEIAPDSTLWMFRGRDNEPERVTTEDLLPGFFTGAALLRRSDG
ncbi:MAG: cytidine deaminase [Rhodothermales bacterium]|nr:cytidine deaminase [Rhodothermales bacterium]